MTATGGARREPRHHDGCFGCGRQNAAGLRLELQPDGPDRLRGRFLLRPELQGPPGYGHGGIVAAVLDEAMSLLVHVRGVTARTAGLEITYRAPPRVGETFAVEAALEGEEGRTLSVSAKLTTADGRDQVASASAIFVAIGGDGP